MSTLEIPAGLALLLVLANIALCLVLEGRFQAADVRSRLARAAITEGPTARTCRQMPARPRPTDGLPRC